MAVKKIKSVKSQEEEEEKGARVCVCVCVCVCVLILIIILLCYKSMPVITMVNETSLRTKEAVVMK